MYHLTCSIVLYHNDEAEIKKAINSLLQSSLSIKLFLVDNSKTDELKKLADAKNIEYIFNNENAGFGKAHNTALLKAVPLSSYHLILNPDIAFSTGVLEDIHAFMEKNKQVGQLLPKVFYDNGDLQKLCHLLPRPFDLLGRRFFNGHGWAKKLNDKYELKGFNYDQCVNIPNLSGCFMFMRNAVLQKTKYFDERYFMYLEDVDLTRRVHAVSETIFYPYVDIIHKYEKESYSNPVLLRYHINSAIRYFNKWGWLIDKERSRINNAALERLQLK